jgi:hypothetical protein
MKEGLKKERWPLIKKIILAFALGAGLAIIRSLIKI